MMNQIHMCEIHMHDLYKKIPSLKVKVRPVSYWCSLYIRHIVFATIFQVFANGSLAHCHGTVPNIHTC